jgi:RND family efflux transporter MFP subunit
VLVTAREEGIVIKIHVVENSPVKEGDPIAELLPEDADIAWKAAEAEVRLRQAAWEAARVNLEQPVHLQVALAEAEALLAQKETEKAILPVQKSAAESRLRLAKTIYESQKAAFASGALPEQEVLKAKTDFETAELAAKEIETKITRVQAEVAALTTKKAGLALRLELKTDEKRAAAETKAQLDLAQNALDRAALKKKRMTILAPMSGRVLSLVAKPGSRLMGQDPKGLHEASTVLSLYDPKSLQVRADVRLEDAWRIHMGQRVKIAAAAVPTGTLDGEVLFVTGQADVQKNTIQVKVAIANPPEVLRPEMLVQVTFLAPPPRAEATTATSKEARIVAPRSLVLDEEGKKAIWVADASAGVARKRSIELGAFFGDLVEVKAGLHVGDRLIVGGRDELRDGQRITITGEDTSLLPERKTP